LDGSELSITNYVEGSFNGYLKVISCNLPGETEGTYKNSVRGDSVSAEVRTRYLLNTI
jgi:hypothetical protein